MYQLLTFSLDLRRDDDVSPLIGLRFIPNEKNKLFSLIAQEYDIVWSERYKCYILPDEAILGGDILKKHLTIVDSIIERIKENKEIDKEILEREKKQSYYTSDSLANFLSSYINNTSDEDSIILDPSAGTGNLTDKLNIPKKNIYLVEPDLECINILKE